MNLTTFLLSSKSNSKIGGNQITFGTVDFQPHPSTLATVFASLNQEMDLMIESFNFRVGSLGSLRLSDPIPSGPSVGQTGAAATPETFVGLTTKVNSPANGKPAESKRNFVDELDEIMGNLDLEEKASFMESEGNSYTINNYSEEDFMPCYGDVCYNSKDERMPGLELHDNEQAIFL
jgi:hypothetical protein